ncbi:TNF receptor-associated factor 2-like [Amphiura filiformis]|uniref:TNF receptor-associated factor 2-like n=1 Tax=Amphiura filiformis TaxID=82378 RepID=UPI003B2170FC
MPGYPPEVLVDQTALITTLLCCICTQLLKSAVQSTCGHRYCETCVKEKIAQHSDPNVQLRCPACPPDSSEGILNENEIYPDFHARKELKLLKCKCINEGCPWRGNYLQYVEHDPLCDLTPVTCQAPGCGKPLRRGDVPYHLEKDCPVRIVRCRNCGEKLVYMNLKRHNLICPKLKVTCQHCNAKLTREQLERHQDFETGDCPNKKRPCPYTTMGCTTEITAGDASQHMQNQASLHAQLQVNQFEEMKNKVEETLEKIIIRTGSISEAKVGKLAVDAEGVVQDEACAEKSSEATKSKASGNILSDTCLNYIFSKLRDSNVFVLRTENDARVQKSDRANNGKEQNLEKRVKNLEGKLKEKEEELNQMKTLYAVLDKRNETFQEVVAVLNNQLEALAEKIGALERQNRHLQDTIELQERQIHAHDQMLTVKNVALAEQELRIQSLESSSYNGILVWKITEYARRRREAVSGKTTSFYSSPFYTSYHGYKMCARIYLNGDGMGKGTHLSLFFVVMKGRYDNILRWPFRQKVTFMMVDQGNREHVVDAFRPDPTSSSFKKPTHEMNIASGCPLFVALTLLENGNYAYVKDDCLFVKVIVDVSDLERI